jgi:hypothetical protein
MSTRATQRRLPLDRKLDEPIRLSGIDLANVTIRWARVQMSVALARLGAWVGGLLHAAPMENGTLGSPSGSASSGKSLT